MSGSESKSSTTSQSALPPSTPAGPKPTSNPTYPGSPAVVFVEPGKSATVVTSFRTGGSMTPL